ncbi:MAG: hypothetical protein LBH28_01360 [Oscillospiraceae bacterium]|jgi:flagellar motility protein MotE (MotC chaperone)|nr:hypothetical protein [Oscillospiraceae bacterium]
MAESIASEGIENITANEEKIKKPAAKKPRPQQPKTPPVPVQAPMANGAGENMKKEKKKMHILLKILFFVVIPVILVGGFVFEEVYFNKLGIRDNTRDFFISAAIWLDPDTASVKATQDRRTREINRRAVELDNKARELDARKTELSEREKEIASSEKASDERAAGLDMREKELAKAPEVPEELVPIYRRMLTDQEKKDMESLSRTFSRMTPETAVSILTRLYDPNDVAAILYYMSERDAAAVMSVMAADYAAKLTEIFLYE